MVYSRSTHSTPSSPLDDALQLPPTPPSSNHGDSDGSLPPSSPHLPMPPCSPQPQQRPGGRASSSSSSSSSSSAISSSPLLTAPHVSNGTPSWIFLSFLEYTSQESNSLNYELKQKVKSITYSTVSSKYNVRSVLLMVEVTKLWCRSPAAPTRQPPVGDCSVVQNCSFSDTWFTVRGQLDALQT